MFLCGLSGSFMETHRGNEFIGHNSGRSSWSSYTGGVSKENEPPRQCVLYKIVHKRDARHFSCSHHFFFYIYFFSY
jgi:hypothetical protein